MIYFASQEILKGKMPPPRRNDIHLIFKTLFVIVGNIGCDKFRDKVLSKDVLESGKLIHSQILDGRCNLELIELFHRHVLQKFLGILNQFQ
jgi:hypothetical protein